MVDYLHQRGIGVILDWVPAHFPADAHGLAYFDGTHLYEHADPRQGLHPDWGTLDLQLRPQRGPQLPDLQRPVLARQVSHRRPARGRRRLDALPRLLAQARRVDAQPVRRPREPGGHRLPATLQRARLRQLSRTSQTIAEESTAWPMVSRPTYLGGLGFGFKWDMGWMHDTLALLRARPDPPQVPSQRAHLPHAVRLHRELRPAAVARRSGPRQRLAAVARCPATTGRSSPTCGCCSAICTPTGQETAVHGRRVRPAAASGTTTPASTGTCSTIRRTPACQQLGARPEPLYRARARPARAATASPPASSGSMQRRRAEHPELSAQGQVAAAMSSWWCATSRRCRARTTGSACRAAATGTSCSTATRTITAAAAWATSAASSAAESHHGRPNALQIILPPLGVLFFKGVPF